MISLAQLHAKPHVRPYAAGSAGHVRAPQRAGRDRRPITRPEHPPRQENNMLVFQIVKVAAATIEVARFATDVYAAVVRTNRSGP